MTHATGAARAALLATLMLCGAVQLHAQTAPQVSFRIVETDPASRTTLGPDQPFYIRIAYESDVPVRFRAEGLRQGNLIEEGASYNPAPAYPAGSGEALAWLAFSGDTYIDAIRITARSEERLELRVEQFDRDAQWSATRSGSRRTAAWAEKMSDEQQRIALAAMRTGQDPGPSDALISALMTASIPAYVVLQAFLLLRLRGGWRKAAMLPLVGMVALVLYTVAAAAAGSGLWPLMLLLLTPFFAAYLVALWVVWFVAGRASARPVVRGP